MIDHIAIAGLGSIGRRHLRLVREFRPDLEITVVRSSEGNGVPEEKFADVVVYNIEDSLARGIQAAIIATPAVFHLNQAVQFLQAGVDVLVEKPLSMSIVGVDELIRLQEAKGLIGLVGYCMRYDPAAEKFKKMLKSKKTGQILHVHVNCGSYLPDWRPEQDYKQSASAIKEFGGGVLLELSHELDYVRWFFGKIETVTAILENSGTLGLDVEESADLILKTVEGIPISVHLDFNSRISRRRCVAHCSAGVLTWDAVQKTVSWQSFDRIEKEESFTHDRDELYRLQLKHFFECIENNQKPLVSLEDGVEVLRIVEAARESNANRIMVVLT